MELKLKQRTPRALGTLLLAMLPLCAACTGSEATGGAEASPSVFVGNAKDAAQPDTGITAAIVIHAGQLQFSACGDEAEDTLWVRIGGDLDDEAAAETPIDVDSNWTLRGTIWGDDAAGSAVKRTNGQAIEWQMQRVPEEDVAGVYTDDLTCPTEVVVGRGGAVVHGSYCVAAMAGVRAQVTPIAPASLVAQQLGCIPLGKVCRDLEGDGIWVSLGDTGEAKLVKRADPAGR